MKIFKWTAEMFICWVPSCFFFVVTGNHTHELNRFLCCVIDCPGYRRHCDTVITSIDWRGDAVHFLPGEGHRSCGDGDQGRVCGHAAAPAAGGAPGCRLRRLRSQDSHRTRGAGATQQQISPQPCSLGLELLPCSALTKFAEQIS